MSVMNCGANWRSPVGSRNDGKRVVARYRLFGAMYSVSVPPTKQRLVRVSVAMSIALIVVTWRPSDAFVGCT